MMFENRVMREIFWLKRKEITVEWRKLNNNYLLVLIIFMLHVKNYWLLSKNLKIKIYRTIILPVVLYLV